MALYVSYFVGVRLSVRLYHQHFETMRNLGRREIIPIWFIVAVEGN